ncbi:beta-phosphoglucomutase [Arenibacter certesii]|uniref:Beta-phosphoglucomutase n=1 Tax=Arenibacter certesii TaxID=228955 RepID=A0A918MKU1_9FLAO|nr:beta-phosphoglucomutase [Arenibacter certesii]GGW33900.1 beta-phosphoglucomutase [Arenibacter certesii]
MREVGFIFDLDGVIVDTAKYHFLAWRKLANELGFEFTKEQNEMFKGVSRRRCLEILLDIGGVTATTEQFNRWLIEKNEDYLSYIEKMDQSEILPDVERVLSYLRSKNIPIALGSASKNAIPILEKVKLTDFFEVVVDGNHVTKAKPDPEVFMIAAKQIGVSAQNCVVFEDAIAGIEAANKAKMVSIGIGDAQVLTSADYVFKNFTEMDTSFLDKLINQVD